MRRQGVPACFALSAKYESLAGGLENSMSGDERRIAVSLFGNRIHTSGRAGATAPLELRAAGIVVLERAAHGIERGLAVGREKKQVAAEEVARHAEHLGRGFAHRGECP
jgi:hypothetical protein